MRRIPTRSPSRRSSSLPPASRGTTPARRSHRSAATRSAVGQGRSERVAIFALAVAHSPQLQRWLLGWPRSCCPARGPPALLDCSRRAELPAPRPLRAAHDRGRGKRAYPPRPATGYRYVRAGVRAGDGEVAEQLGHSLGGHRGAAIGMNGQGALLDALVSHCSGDELLGELGVLRRGHHPSHDVAGEDVDRHVAVEPHASVGAA